MLASRWHLCRLKMRYAKLQTVLRHYLKMLTWLLEVQTDPAKEKELECNLLNDDETSMRQRGRFLCKMKQIKRFCYLIKWHGNSSTLTLVPFTLIVYISKITPTCDNCNLHFCLLFYHQTNFGYLKIHSTLTVNGEQTDTDKKKIVSRMICTVSFLLHHFRIINPRQSFSLTIVSPLVV